MTPIKNQQVLTANGEYAFEPFSVGPDVLVEWCITAGTATVIPGYVNLAGTFSPARGLDSEQPSFGPEGGMVRLPVPNSGQVALKIESADSLSLIVCQSRTQP